MNSERRRLKRRAKRGKPYLWTLPLGLYRYAYLQTPSRLMTEDEWQQMLRLLDVLKPGLVSGEQP